jgi:hypothetical protein
MQAASRSNDPAAAMIAKRLGAAGALLCLAAMLGACAPFSGFVADHWPHWAGGLPSDVPPRPGTPGYDDFVAHGEPAQNTAAPNAAAPASAPSPDAASGAPPAAKGAATGTIPQNSTAATGAPQFKARNSKVQIGRLQSAPAQADAQQRTQAAAPAEPVEAPSAEDPSVVKGGLY